LILITGYNGYLGMHLTNAIPRSNLILLGRDANADIQCDLALSIPEIHLEQQIERVIHVAGKAHIVPKNAAEEKAFYDVNEEGTRHLLKGLDNLKCKPKQVVFISSIAVYNASTPYAQSKLQAEQLITDWCVKNTCNALILRLPLIFGFGAPGNLGAMERAIQKGYYFGVGTGKAKRSVVLIEELVEELCHLVGSESGTYNLISKDMSYIEVEAIFASKYHKKIRRLPSILVRLLAQIGNFVPGFPINFYRLQKLENTETYPNTFTPKRL
jgi:nucleoside-diphosphate-sugar epimerase